MGQVNARPQIFFASSALAPGAFRVLEMRGFEAIHQLYEFELTLQLMESEPLDSEAAETVLRSPVVLGFGERGMLEHPWHGILRELELTHAHGFVYRAVMVPALWYTTQTFRTRVFLDLSVPEIVRRVLTDHGLAAGEHYELALSASYPTREYVLQYAESDFDFIARLMEHEGIFFFFDQGEHGELMVIGDSSSAFREIPGRASLKFDPRADITFAGGAIHTVSKRYRIVPQHMVLREYQPDLPSLPMQSDRAIDTKGFGWVELHGENTIDRGDQQRICRVRAEERTLERHMHGGLSSVRGLHAGHRFRLEGHPFGELDDIELVTISMRHSIMQGHDRTQVGGRAFGSEIDLLPHAIPYRPARITPRARIDGVIHAKIDGENPGVPAPLDDQGRYKVLLPFDVAGAVGGKASAWMRMTQTFSGPGYGMHFPLHVGADVLIAHVEGDPDRPVIVGALPTPSAISPVVQENATQSVVRSKANIVVELEDDAR
jgi:type VI secretion system secreted protein VgrG